MWKLRNEFKLLFRGAPAASVCSTADPELAKELLVNGPIESLDTPTCWLCLVLKH